MNTTREAFEAWAQQPQMEFDIRRFGDNSAWPGNYHSYPTQCAWEAWQAACTAEREACAKVCESERDEATTPSGALRAARCAAAIRARGRA